MLSSLSLEAKYSKIRRRLCFYLDIDDQELSRSLSRRLQDMGLQQEWVLSARVTHAVLGARARGRADAMPRGAAPPRARLSVRQAISLLDKLYDTFFAAPRKSHVKLFTKDFIKIEFLDKLWKPVYKEFDEFPAFSLEPDVPREKRDKKQSPEAQPNDINQNVTNTSHKMTRKSRPLIKEKEDKEQKGGYCEMCHCDYAELQPHRASAQHAAFARDHGNFLALDSLIAAGADVATFLAKDAALHERRSLRKLCNGELLPGARKRCKRSQSPDSTVDGDAAPDDRPYYRVVGVSTKLRSSGGFPVKKKESPPPCNGAKPLVVKFRKVRRSELSVLSDEAEQFMFPKRASSSSSTASSEDERAQLARRRSPPPPAPAPPSAERRRLARPLALKEESSEEDGWPDSPRRRKRRVLVGARRGRRRPLLRGAPTVGLAVPVAPPEPELPEPEQSPTPAPLAEPEPPPLEPAPSPLRERSDGCVRSDSCMRWEDGRLHYPPAVERLEFAFESVPHSEPWFDTFRRQDERRLAVKNVPEFFALYSTDAPKLPYEIGPLPPLKPNCCPLSALVRGPRGRGGGRGGRGAGRGGRGAPRAGAYGTRGTLLAARARRRGEPAHARPRKSPREHASTLAIAGLLRRPAAPAEDARSTASDDTGSDTLASLRRAALGPATAPAPPPAAEHCARLRRFLEEVFSDVADAVLEAAGDSGGGAVPVLAAAAPDVPGLVAGAETCDALSEHLRAAAHPAPAPVCPAPAPTRPAPAPTRPARRPRPRKKNRTGWPSKRKTKKGSRSSSLVSRPLSDSLSGPEPASDVDDEEAEDAPDSPVDDVKTETESVQSEDSAPLGKNERPASQLEEKAVSPPKEEEPASKQEDPARKLEEAASKAEAAGGAARARRRGVGAGWLQPVVRVQRVEVPARRLRSAAHRR